MDRGAGKHLNTSTTRYGTREIGQPTFIGQVREEPGTLVHLVDYYLSLEGGKVKFLVEERVRDTD